MAERLNDPQNDYFITLLQQACIAAEPKYGICNLQPVLSSMHQGRQLVSLDRGTLSIMWTVSNIEREELYHPIRIPLIMGLIGARISVHHPQITRFFTSDTPLSSIKQLSSVQGHDWPDLAILQHNKFNVAGINWNESVYRMLNKQVFDVVYRSILEVDFEVEHQGSAVIIDKNHLFYYPSVIYFFVSTKNLSLHKRIKYGLEKLVNSGRIEELLLSDSLHRNLHHMLVEQQRKMHYLQNPLLPQKTPLDNKKLWLLSAPKQ